MYQSVESLYAEMCSLAEKIKITRKSWEATKLKVAKCQLNLIKFYLKNKNNNSIGQNLKEEEPEISKTNSNLDIVGKILNILIKSEDYQGSLGLEVLEFLTNYGMPLNEFVYDEDEYDDPDVFYYAPIHICIRHGRIDYVSLLLKQGADIHKKSAFEESCLWLAVKYCDESMVNLLLKNGSKVNEALWLAPGPSVLDAACEFNKPEIINILLKHGAEIEDDMPWICSKGKERLAKELAKLKFENKCVENKHLERLQSKYNRELRLNYKDCLNELRRMKNHEVCDGLSTYNVFKLSKNRRKLIFLLKNQDFVMAFKSPRNLKRFRHFGSDLDNIFNEGLEKRNILQSQVKRIYESGLKEEFSLPSEIVEKIAYFAIKDKIDVANK